MPQDVGFFKRLRAVLKRPSIRYAIPNDRPSSSFQQRLHNQFLTSSRNLYQQSLAGSTERYARVRDYELQDTTSSLCSLALNTYSDNASQVGDLGLIVGIKTEYQKVREELEILYYDIMNIDFNSWHWIRNMCKYGDMFLLLDVFKNDGITSYVSLPTIEIEREEGFDNDVNSVRFKWTYNNGAVYENFQIAHFRIKGDDTFLPYGRAILEPARRPWKQYNLIFDAMLSYRIARAPERRIFYIDIGNIGTNDITGFMQRVRDQLKRQPLMDTGTGQQDMRYNAVALDEDFWIPIRGESKTRIDTLPGACLALDTKIKLLDGRNETLQTLINEYESGKQNWVYSCNPSTGKIVVAPISWAGVTRKNTDVMKITLDNNESVVCTLDHKFLLRNGTKIEAKDLKVDDSLMPLYTKRSSTKNGDRLEDYEMLFDNEEKKWKYTHRVVTNYLANTGLINKKVYKEEYIKNKQVVIHHNDVCRSNNNPSNLFIMDSNDHYMFHAEKYGVYFGKKAAKAMWEKYRNNSELYKQYIEKKNKSYAETVSKRTEEEQDEINENIRNGINNYLENLSPDEKEKRAENSRQNFLLASEARMEKQKENPEWAAEIYERAGKKQSETKKSKEYIEKKYSVNFDKDLFDIMVKHYKDGYIYYHTLVNKLNDDNYFMTKFNLLNPNKSKHMKDKFTRGKLFKLLKQFNYVDLHDFGKKLELNNHKIINIEYLKEKIDVGTITVDSQEKYHNYHNFALSCGIIIQNSNLGDIEDVRLIRSELISALGIPSIYVDDHELGAGRTLGAQQDLQFARSIQRIQKAFLSELTKVGIIHLLAKGFEAELVKSFSLTMTPPSAILEMQKLEVFDKRFQIYSNAIRDKGVSRRYAQKYILNLTNDEISLCNKEVETDARLVAKLNGIEQGGAAAGAMGGAGSEMLPPATGEKSPLAVPGAETMTDASINDPDLISADETTVDRSLLKNKKRDYLTKAISEAALMDREVKNIVANLNRKIEKKKILTEDSTSAAK